MRFVNSQEIWIILPILTSMRLDILMASPKVYYKKKINIIHLDCPMDSKRSNNMRWTKLDVFQRAIHNDLNDASQFSSSGSNLQHKVREGTYTYGTPSERFSRNSSWASRNQLYPVFGSYTVQHWTFESRFWAFWIQLWTSESRFWVLGIRFWCPGSHFSVPFWLLGFNFRPLGFDFRT